MEFFRKMVKDLEEKFKENSESRIKNIQKQRQSLKHKQNLQKRKASDLQIKGS